MIGSFHKHIYFFLLSNINSRTSILQRDERPKQPSILLRDFHCGQVGANSSSTDSKESLTSKLDTKYLLANFISYQSFLPFHEYFVNSIFLILSPHYMSKHYVIQSDVKQCRLSSSLFKIKTHGL